MKYNCVTHGWINEDEVDEEGFCTHCHDVVIPWDDMKYVVMTRGKSGQLGGRWHIYMGSIFPFTDEGLKQAKALVYKRAKTYSAWEFKVCEMHGDNNFMEIGQ